jgi:WD40 repeat protein
VDSAAFSGDGKWVVTASTDKTARIWDAESGKEIAVLKGHAHSVDSAAFSGDGKWVVTASTDKTARIWDAESGKEIAVLNHANFVWSAVFSEDGKRVVTASADKTARIWEVTWATLVRGGSLRERVCAEKLIGAAQEFTDSEMEDDPILRGIDKNDPVARNPCLRRGPLSLDYWTRLPGQLWRSTRRPVGVN